MSGQFKTFVGISACAFKLPEDRPNHHPWVLGVRYLKLLSTLECEFAISFYEHKTIAWVSNYLKVVANAEIKELIGFNR